MCSESARHSSRVYQSSPELCDLHVVHPHQSLRLPNDADTSSFCELHEIHTELLRGEGFLHVRHFTAGPLLRERCLGALHFFHLILQLHQVPSPAPRPFRVSLHVLEQIVGSDVSTAIILFLLFNATIDLSRDVVPNRHRHSLVARILVRAWTVPALEKAQVVVKSAACRQVGSWMCSGQRRAPCRCSLFCAVATPSRTPPV